VQIDRHQSPVLQNEAGDLIDALSTFQIREDNASSPVITRTWQTAD
jgi:hypothetical protein